MNTFYTLHVDVPGLVKRTGIGIARAILNLRLRLAHEMRKQEQACFFNRSFCRFG
jgi:hypothetical protein